MSIGSPKANATGILEGLGKIGFSAEGVNGGVELVQ